jgi:hypothetical protein
VNNSCVQGFDSATFMTGSADSAMNFCECSSCGQMYLLRANSLSMPGLSESLSNGTVGQFAKRGGQGSTSSSTKILYPPNKDKLEQQTVAASLSGQLTALPSTCSFWVISLCDALCENILRFITRYLGIDYNSQTLCDPTRLLDLTSLMHSFARKTPCIS